MSCKYKIYLDSDVCSLLAAMVTRWLSVSSSQLTTCEIEKRERGKLVRVGREGKKGRREVRMGEREEGRFSKHMHLLTRERGSKMAVFWSALISICCWS